MESVENSLTAFRKQRPDVTDRVPDAAPETGLKAGFAVTAPPKHVVLVAVPGIEVCTMNHDIQNINPTLTNASIIQTTSPAIQE